MPTIKRYPNRKLYDTEAKRYVTLDEITQMIRKGNDVQVIDHESGDDLTTLTLTQIILEQEKKSTDGFLPRTLLTSLIRTGGDTLEQLLRSVQLGLVRPGGDGATDDPAAPRDEPAEERTTPERVDMDGDRTPKSAKRPMADDWQGELLHMLKMPSHRDLQDLQLQLAILNERLDEVLNARPAGQARVVDEDDDRFGEAVG